VSAARNNKENPDKDTGKNERLPGYVYFPWKGKQLQ